MKTTPSAITRLALVVQFNADMSVSINDDYEVMIPNSMHISEARKLDRKDVPFVVMTTDHWNAFQDLLDNLGIREQFKRARGFAIAIPKANILLEKTEKTPVISNDPPRSSPPPPKRDPGPGRKITP